MPDLSKNHHVRKFLPALRKAAAGRNCFLVGGAIRDWLLKRDVHDFDFATPDDPTGLCRDFAEALGGHWFFLDQARRQVRVVADLDATRITFDFAPFRAPTLADDLALRDFTLNSMAFPLEADWCLENLLDFMEGRRDLAAGILRVTSDAVLRSDPLRILKGIRHCLELGLQLDPDTLLRMNQAVSDLRHVAVERIRQEMLRIFTAPDQAGRSVSLLLESGVGRFFWGERFADSDSLLVRSRFRCAQFWKILEGTPFNSSYILDEIVEDGLTRSALLQWVSLLDSLHPDCATETARAWRFSRHAQQRIDAVSRLTDQEWADFERVAHHRRSLLLWTARYGPDPVDLLLGMALRLKLAPAAAVEKILSPLAIVLQQAPDFQVDDLVDGHFLKRECGLSDGREIGRILDALRSAEIYGRITSRSEAEALAVSLCNKND